MLQDFKDTNQRCQKSQNHAKHSKVQLSGQKKEQKNCEQTGKIVHTIPINLTQYLPPSQQFTTA